MRRVLTIGLFGLLAAGSAWFLAAESAEGPKATSGHAGEFRLVYDGPGRPLPPGSSGKAPAPRLAEPMDRSCDQRAAVLKFLAKQYKEQPTAMGIAKNGGLIEVLTSRDGSTFTIIVTDPEGETCMVAAGNTWESVGLQAYGI